MQSFNKQILCILGGGQLGRMLIQPCINFNIDVHILDPDPHAPCKDICQEFTVGKLTDFDTVYQFGQRADIITIEIENVNTDALKKLEEEGKKVYPPADTIKLIQDKGLQKTFYKEHKIPTSEFLFIDSKSDLEKHKDFLPAALKLRTEGYDGKGVMILNTEQAIDKAFDAPCVLEKKVTIDKELSVICARNVNGDIVAYPPVEAVFNPTYNLVDYLISPAAIDESISKKAQDIARNLTEELAIVGLLAIEMFLDTSGNILVNEIAPRPHNSGHQSIEGNYTSQFEQHIRAIFNLPLGATDIIQPAVMINLLGAEGHTGDAIYEGIEQILDTPGAYIHLYGKKITKPSRKMGHINFIGKDIAQVTKKALSLKNTIKVIS